MLRTSLIAAALLIASTGAMAYNNDYVYGRVVTVEPHFVISFGGGRQHDGFRILYEVGGQQYWTHSPYRPGPVFWVPRPVNVYPIHHQEYPRWNGRGWDGRHDRHGGWDDHDRGHDGPRDGHGRR